MTSCTLLGKIKYHEIKNISWNNMSAALKFSICIVMKKINFLLCIILT